MSFGSVMHSSICKEGCVGGHMDKWGETDMTSCLERVDIKELMYHVRETKSDALNVFDLL